MEGGFMLSRFVLLQQAWSEEPYLQAWSDQVSGQLASMFRYGLGGELPSDDPLYQVVGAQIQGSYFPVTSSGSSSAISSAGAGVVPVSSGGITINLVFDAAAMAAPTSFRSGIQQAASIIASEISDKITVNIKIDYSGTGGGSAAGPDNGLFESYSSVRANLINLASSADVTFNGLPAGTLIQNQSNVAVWNAELKLWGLLNPNDTTTDDGSATFATDINPNLLVGVALHELTHAMGRVPYGPQPDVFDLFRFTGPGTHLFQGGSTAPAAYFSLDNGTTKLADYGRNLDPSDFLNSGVQGPNDPFNEYYTSSTSQQLSTVDLKQLDALGFHFGPSNTFSVGPTDTTNLFGTIVHTVQGAGGQIDALYDGILGRAPDPLGYEGWMSATEHGASLHDIAAAFLASPEGQSHVGSPDNATFLQELYQTALHRPADSTGLQGWLNLLNSGTSRADVALDIALSAEHVTDMQPSLNAGVFAPDPDASNVARLYYGLLGRAPDAGGLAGWTNIVKSGASLQSVAQAFMNSVEYQSQHAGMTNTQLIDSLYVDALGRHADPVGLQGWLNAVSGGASQTAEAIGIAESPEAQQHHLAQIESGWLLA
jgi:hypothetical protein